jgi:uncharacterized phage-associated protein
MPGWSEEVAMEFVRLAEANRSCLNQMQLQKLVYIAHGWCLAATGQPLTGDRPEAWKFGPVYVRLASVLRSLGTSAVTLDLFSSGSTADLETFEMDLIVMTWRDLGMLQAPQLAILTQRAGTPWKSIYANGAGEGRDIPHRLVADQFCEMARDTVRKLAC